MKTSYASTDVTFLLTDLSGKIQELTIEEKEARIQAGESYAGFISREATPTASQRAILSEQLATNSATFAVSLAALAEILLASNGEQLVLVSLARAGTPIGILLRRYFQMIYTLDIPHYSVSIIRGSGIDTLALAEIVRLHPHAHVQFVDGWTGKGSIRDALETSIAHFNAEYNQTLSADLAVVADPARRAQYYAVREDILMPNCSLNATISGLISRTIASDEYLQNGAYHGAIYLDYLADADQSNLFLNHISHQFVKYELPVVHCQPTDSDYAVAIVAHIQTRYRVKNIHKIKLSIGEVARVLLRRRARVILLKDFSHPDVQLLMHLANEKGVEVIEVGSELLHGYQAAAIIHE